MDIIKQAYEFFMMHWESIAAVLTALATFANAMTEHSSSKQSAIPRYIFWFIGVVSFWRSKNESHPTFMKVKMPLVPEKKQ